MYSWSSRWLTAALLGGIVGAVQPGAAAEWPTRQIHAIVPVGAGSATDSISRLIFDKLAQRLGQSIVVENRPGAGGVIGAAAAAKAEPDGYNWLVISNAQTIAPELNRNIPYDLKRDFVGVTLLGTSPLVLVVVPKAGVQTVQDLVRLAKAKPGTLTFSASGVGSPSHIAGELFRQSADIDTRLVQFKSPPEATSEVVAGRIDYVFSTIPIALGLIRNNQLKPLAIFGTLRASSFPELPTTIEAGFAKTDKYFWFGLCVPAGTPADIVAKINSETVAALTDTELQTRLRDVGLEPRTMPVSEFNSFLAKEIQDAPAVAKAAGLTEAR